MSSFFGRRREQAGAPPWLLNDGLFPSDSLLADTPSLVSGERQDL